MEENTWHAFYDCPKAKECWEVGGLWTVMTDTIYGAEGFIEATFELLSQLNSSQLTEFFSLVWSIWRRRNHRVWKGEELNTSLAVEMFREFMQSWTKVRKGADGNNWQIASDVDLIWKPPKPGEVKCNMDATLFATDGVFGVGFCIRDSTRAFIKAQSMWFHGSPSPKEVEAVALVEAVKWVQAIGYTNMTFELDNKAVVDYINDEHAYNNELRTILDNCRQCLKYFNNYEVSFIMCNMDATLFATNGVFGVGFCNHDSTRAFIKAQSMWFHGSPSPKEAEAVALLEAVKWVQAIGYTNMTFELDNKAVVDYINDEHAYNNELRTILDNCRQCLKYFDNYEVSFIMRQTNFIAHSLARTSRIYASH